MDIETDSASDTAPVTGQGALSFFATWTVIGLFVDGWAHNAGKPEDFFTPWHAILYSGFVCGVGYFVLREVLSGRQALPEDNLMTWGVAGFVAGAVGDGVWHTVFGVENDVEALLSPTHLLLMVSGIALVSAPARWWQQRTPVRGPEFVAPVVSVTLSLAVVGFFLQFASSQRIFDPDVYAGGMVDEVRTIGVMSILVTNVVVVAAVAWVRRTWGATPVGTFTVILGGTALLLSVLDGFEDVVLVLPFLAAGAAADLVDARNRSDRAVVVVVPLVLWPLWFLVYDLHRGLGWEAEMWTGSVVYAVLTAVGIDLVAAAASRRTETPVRSTVSSS